MRPLEKGSIPSQFGRLFHAPPDLIPSSRLDQPESQVSAIGNVPSQPFSLLGRLCRGAPGGVVFGGAGFLWMALVWSSDPKRGTSSTPATARLLRGAGPTSTKLKPRTADAFCGLQNTRSWKCDKSRCDCSRQRRPNRLILCSSQSSIYGVFYIRTSLFERYQPRYSPTMTT